MIKTPTLILLVSVSMCHCQTQKQKSLTPHADSILASKEIKITPSRNCNVFKIGDVEIKFCSDSTMELKGNSKVAFAYLYRQIAIMQLQNYRMSAVLNRINLDAMYETTDDMEFKRAVIQYYQLQVAIIENIRNGQNTKDSLIKELWPVY